MANLFDDKNKYRVEIEEEKREIETVEKEVKQVEKEEIKKELTEE